ncbi:uncharacterized protein [Littorina saxatilis]|uniref:RING-type domain-containing protein n=1 Tax=Littorina saxatilis TaxID=31220 RepID=A0AAN9BE77_9CAEN
MSQNPAPLRETQESYEQRFNCLVCLCPRLEMVTGMCQHRVCVDCLYEEEGQLKNSFVKCPVCQHRGTFPAARPEIPEDNIKLMQCLGVRVCPNHSRGCNLEMWEWEIEDHLRLCTIRQRSPLQSVTPTKSKSSDRKQPHKATGRPSTRSSVRRYSFRSHPHSK